MEQVKPWWWERYHTPYTEEHQIWYNNHKADITVMEKDMNWETGDRSVTYFNGKNKMNQFNDKF